MDSYQARFGGIGRLVGLEGLRRLRQAHVCVVGVGGVGSWAVEALARSGLGALTLVDLDDVCVSNVNRQLPAVDGQFGRPKVEVLAERVRAIQPECALRVARIFFSARTADDILATPIDYVMDAVDGPADKALLALKCREKNLPLLMAGGAGGRRDPTAIRIADLSQVTHDRLLGEVRRRLRAAREPRQEPKDRFGIACVYSLERPVFPQPDGSVCGTRAAAGADLRLDCKSGYGTASFVTGAFGFAAAARIVGDLTK